MERAEVAKDDVLDGGTHFLFICVETTNSCLVMLSEGEDKLGTLAIAVPTPMNILGCPVSSILLGDKNAISARMFAELVASRKEKMALVSIYLEKIGESQAQPVFKRLIEKAVQTRPRSAGEERTT